LESNDKVIDLIQKLLALSKSPNENEAILALRKAQELLEKYNLSMRDIPMDTIIQDVKMVNLEFPIESKEWKKYLIHYIAQSNFCTTVLSSKSLHVLGRNTNVVATVIMSSWIMDQLDSLALMETRLYQGPTSKVKYKNSFLWGATERINQRLKEGTQERAQVNTNLKALIIDLKSEVENFKAQQFPRLVSHSVGGYHDREGYSRGQEAGSKISLYGSNIQVSEERLLT